MAKKSKAKPLHPRDYSYQGPCDVLLINPPWLSKDENIWNGVKSAMPPLGLLSIAAYVEAKGYCVRVHIEKYTAAELIKKLKLAQPKFVGMGVMTATSNAANQIPRIVKNTVPNCTVVFGGVHSEAMPAETLCNSAVDIVVRGDGEETFLSILQDKPLEGTAQSQPGVAHPRSHSCFLLHRVEKKLGTRGEVRRVWLGTRKEDFFDLNVSEARMPHLTFEVRQKEISLEPEELVPSIAAGSPLPLPA